jgi:hypothetical protein
MKAASNLLQVATGYRRAFEAVQNAIRWLQDTFARGLPKLLTKRISFKIRPNNFKSNLIFRK